MVHLTVKGITELNPNGVNTDGVEGKDAAGARERGEVVLATRLVSATKLQGTRFEPKEEYNYDMFALLAKASSPPSPHQLCVGLILNASYSAQLKKLISDSFSATTRNRVSWIGHVHRRGGKKAYESRWTRA